MAFSPLGNSYHIFTSVSISFSSNLMKNAPFRYTAFDYPLTDWYCLLNRVRYILWDIF